MIDEDFGPSRKGGVRVLATEGVGRIACDARVLRLREHVRARLPRAGGAKRPSRARPAQAARSDVRRESEKTGLSTVIYVHTASDWWEMRASSPGAPGAYAEPHRCTWCGEDPLLVDYHDAEWGVPSTDERHLFEMLTLEGAQAGLSWITILRKRDAYRAAFAGFDASQVARFDDQRVSVLCQDAGIVRNRAKIESTVSNARAVLSLWDEDRTLGGFLWKFVDDRPVQNAFARG